MIKMRDKIFGRMVGWTMGWIDEGKAWVREGKAFDKKAFKIPIKPEPADDLFNIEEIEISASHVYIVELVSEPGKQPMLCIGRQALMNTLMDLAKSGVEQVMISAYVCSHSYSMSLPTRETKVL